MRDAGFARDARLRRVGRTHRITYHSAAASLIGNFYCNMELGVVFLYTNTAVWYNKYRGESMAKFSMTKQKFINQWLRHFAQGINKGQYEKYVKDQYVWHVFSWELIKPDGLLIGDAARQAYNEAVKTDCIFCDMYNNGGVTDKLSPQYDTAEKIDENLTEFYVVAKDYSWTYIKTHECDLCGPYFLRNAE
ncbi:MAG: DUF4275 family protein [Clostridia bacterium]|nr:DUF4275 family protein [Clostridia bacterium]